MNDKRTLAAIGGFAFVAAWIGFGFGDALLCLLGAAVAWVAVGVLEGKIDLAVLQSRLSGEEAAPAPPPTSAGPPRRPAGRPRVQ
jgi:hypothetical protein